jgi:hypothetical protein
MMAIPVKPFEIRPENTISHEFLRAQLPLSGNDALIVAFSGEYGIGSRGNVDGEYMAAMVSAALSFTSPWCLVYDFSELNYEWGDMMHKVLCAGDGYWNVPATADDEGWSNRQIDYAIVVSDRCEQAVMSLLTQEMEIEDLSVVHRDLQSALHALDTGLAAKKAEQ